MFLKLEIINFQNIYHHMNDLTYVSRFKKYLILQYVFYYLLYVYCL